MAQLLLSRKRRVLKTIGGAGEKDDVPRVGALSRERRELSRARRKQAESHKCVASPVGWPLRQIDVIRRRVTDFLAASTRAC